MKNVLIIASLYGSKRVLSLAKYLPEFGWQPTIITPPVRWYPTIITSASREKPDMPFEIIETGYKDKSEPLQKALRVSTVEEARVKLKRIFKLRYLEPWVDRLFNLGGCIVNYPDAQSGWCKFALDACSKYIESNEVDALISICPVTSHIVAHELKKRYQIPWISDSPDPWAQNPNYAYGKIRQWLDKRLEQRTRANADALVAISELRANQLGQLHPDKPIHAITLGYDPQDYNGEVTLTKKFTITYTGVIYKEKQDISKLLVALTNLIASGEVDPEDCEVHFYGSPIDWGTINQSLWDIVRQHGRIPQADVIQIQRESQLLLLLDWDDPTDLGVQPGKIFEYLGARRPILATGGIQGNVVDELIKETNAGYHAVSVVDVQQVISQCYAEYRLRGAVTYTGEEAEVQKHSQHRMAGKFADLLTTYTVAYGGKK